MSITDFLLARIAEDEAVARAAAESKLMHNAAPWPAVKASDTWVADHGMIYSDPAEGEEWGHMLYDNEGAEALSMPAEAAAHIARHDPARVLAECAAKRAIVEMHQPMKDDGWVSGESHGYLWCSSCGSVDYDSPVPYPCDTIRALAAVYADHDEYQDEWRVGA